MKIEIDLKYKYIFIIKGFKKKFINILKLNLNVLDICILNDEVLKFKSEFFLIKIIDNFCFVYVWVWYRKILSVEFFFYYF